MPLIAAIAAVMIVSYTVFRLQYAANNLPYDPGLPHPTVDVAAEPAATLTERLRSAFASRHSARVTTASGSADTREAWPLFGLERERAIRLLDEQIQAGRRRPIEQRTADTCQHLATVVAARKSLDEAHAFVVEAPLKPLPEQGSWRYWSTLLFEKNARQRILYVAIDLTQFPVAGDASAVDPKTFDPR